MEQLAENFYHKLILLILPDNLRLIQGLFISFLLLQLLILLELLCKFFLLPLNNISRVIIVFRSFIRVASLISWRIPLVHLIRHTFFVRWTLRILCIHILLLFGWEVVRDHSGLGNFNFLALQIVSTVGVCQMWKDTRLVFALGRPVSDSCYSVRVSLNLIQCGFSGISSLDVLSMKRPVV